MSGHERTDQSPVVDIVDCLRGVSFHYVDEDELQRGLSFVLTDAGYRVQREVALAPGERIDLMVGHVGIEVKIASTAATVHRQLKRYAATGLVDALILVTNRARHMTLDEITIGSVPVTVVRLPWM